MSIYSLFSFSRSVICIFMFCSFITCTGIIIAQPDFSKIQFLKGYVNEVSGENIEYHSSHPSANRALLTRCTDGKKKIEWTTETIPNTKDEYIYFLWIAGFSTGTSADIAHFDLLINNQKYITITTEPNSKKKFWSFMGEKGSELFFINQMVDMVGDLFGKMILKLPVKNFQAGKPLLLQVVGEKADRRDWYMTFKYVYENSVTITAQPAWNILRNDTCQIIDIKIDHILENGKAFISVNDLETRYENLHEGINLIEIPVKKTNEIKRATIKVALENSISKTGIVELKPFKKKEIYILHHSHNDIGYSDLQEDVEKKQLKNIRDAIECSKKTQNYPREAQFKWNVEILWAVESFLDQASESERSDFIDMVKKGNMGLQSLYTNALTGISRGEELFRLTDFSGMLSKKYSLNINSAMISDIPGFSWGIVPSLALKGVKYLSSGPNYIKSEFYSGDRVGNSNKAWGDKPFYWISPSGKEKVLFWMAGKGYSCFHGFAGKFGTQTRKVLFDYINELDSKNYLYEMVQLRYTVFADNGPIDPDMPDFVKKWNEKYSSPQLVISTSSEMFEEFEKRYQNKIPSFSGDFTPYWEDGALSTVNELSMTRRSAERLLQSEALCALYAPGKYDNRLFYNAWKNVLLFDEHTWGASSSISDPDSPFSTKQWKTKKSFALNADSISNYLFSKLTDKRKTPGTSFDIYNTNSWNRTDLVILNQHQTLDYDLVKDQNGNILLSQRLTNGDLAVLVEDVPALCSSRIFLENNKKKDSGKSEQEPTALSNETFDIKLNPIDGSILRLFDKKLKIQFVDSLKNFGLNSYFYVPGTDPLKAANNKVIDIKLKEKGELINSVQITSKAPGCESLVTELRLIKGMNRMDIINTLDKKPVREKEAIHFGFPFSVINGIMRMDLGWGVIKPETDQMAGSCKDYISINNWVDISNDQYGITLISLDAPLIEVGEMTNETRSQEGIRMWKEHLLPSNIIYSYALNNYWHTNYKSDQEGKIEYNYSIYTHNLFNSAECTKFGIERSQPLISMDSKEDIAFIDPPFIIQSKNIIVTSIKPSFDGNGIIVRFYNCSDESENLKIVLKNSKYKKIYNIDPLENWISEFNEGFILPAYGISTLYLSGN